MKLKTVAKLAVASFLVGLSNLGATQPLANDLSLSPGSLNSNDVSILFPLPETPADAANLISIQEIVNSVSDEPVFSEADFKSMLAAGESNFSRVGNRQIRLRDSIRNFSDWKIAGIRFDPSAPGSSADVIAVFGSLPQIRLIVQPVTTSGTRVTAHDVALHLIYDFFESRDAASPGFVRKAVPDNQAVARIISDLLQIKQLSEAAGADTDGDFSVHPGLNAKVPGLATRIKAMLATHLDAARINSGAIMGLNNGGPEPWLFVSMLRSSDANASFQALPSPGLGPVTSPKFSQMLSFLDSPNIQPAPATTNLMPVSSSLLTPNVVRRGVSTAPLFTSITLTAPAVLGQDATGASITDPEITNADIADIVANPTLSHFFNTDCMSCHSETTRREIREIESGEFAFEQPSGVSQVADEVTPENDWNVRNFGWFRSESTITQRTANETAEVVEFIRTNFSSE